MGRRSAPDDFHSQKARFPCIASAREREAEIHQTECPFYSAQIGARAVSFVAVTVTVEPEGIDPRWQFLADKSLMKRQLPAPRKP